MNDYLTTYIIPHLKRFGNVFISEKSRNRYGADEILAALKARGYDCEIQYFRDPGEFRRAKQIDAVIQLRRP